jgi:glycosyltransferase involved in cell wall biosynthesis
MAPNYNVNEMKTDSRILFSIPTRHHVEIALDELEGMQEIGYTCGQFPYAAKEGVTSKLGRVWVILKNAFNLVKVAYKFKPDVIYLNSRVEPLAGIRDFLTIAICKTFYPYKVRFLIKSHGSDLTVLESKNFVLGKIVIPYLKKNVSGWLFLSTEEKKKVSQMDSLANDRTFVTKNIVQADKFKKSDDFKSSMGIPTDHKVLLFAGRIIKEKGIYQVIEAFEKIKDEHKAVLIIVGDGSEYENIKHLIASRGLAGKIILTGFIPEQEVVNFYSNSDILVFPTYFPEGFPMALFNSVVAGMSIITTPTRAAIDFLTAPDNCLWVEPQNSESVYNALTKILRDKPLRERMRKNNIRLVESFSKRQVAIELSEIIDKVIQ